MTITREWEGAAGLEQEQEATYNEPIPIPVKVMRTETELVSAGKASCMSWPVNTFAAMTGAGLSPICPHRYHRYKAKLWVNPGVGATGIVLNTKRDQLAQTNPQGATITFPSTLVTTTPVINQIPLGATGVATYNNNSVGVNQTITGGTVTAIAINGTTTGLTSGVFFVPAGGTVTVTYSVAPTTFSTAAIPVTTGNGPLPMALPDYEAEEPLYAVSIGGPVTVTVIDQAYSNVQ